MQLVRIAPHQLQCQLVKVRTDGKYMDIQDHVVVTLCMDLDSQVSG